MHPFGVVKLIKEIYVYFEPKIFKEGLKRNYCLLYVIELIWCCPGHGHLTVVMCTLSGLWMRLCQVESSLQEIG